MQQKTAGKRKHHFQKISTHGEIRIISGQWRGRKLPVLNLTGLRPTTDRVKETVFNWLAPYLYDSYCLDCYAGSGSLAFEAISRGAKHATLLEKDKAAVNQLLANKQKLNSQALDIIHNDTLLWLANLSKQSFDIVFIDPPFGRQLVNQTINLLEQSKCLANTAWIYIETEVSHSEPHVPLYWQLHRQKQAGQVCYRLYQRQYTEKA
ncbi:MAG: 16S rRNA (guanine(966)-N(2))-methyltransferase RsmD [Candidatus Schmidhempelia sp.]|nr:16S rRNA (guanine(966)-N(2))-methyltransferase RsmD [Candidatus Schmidhempelia sp.]